MRRFRFIRDPLATDLGNNIEEYLRSLGGPACIHLEGRDKSRTRALVTLLHGNEPSGAMPESVQNWLSELRSSSAPVVLLKTAYEPLISSTMWLGPTAPCVSGGMKPL